MASFSPQIKHKLPTLPGSFPPTKRGAIDASFLYPITTKYAPKNFSTTKTSLESF
ncbi:hypothetical protein HMPREF1989_01631 [Porphyromonas gingivalis F0566]|nr:hypothetical protein HMPREF1989_01631 [Porphyromonas gingivalis F0566]